MNETITIPMEEYRGLLEKSIRFDVFADFVKKSKVQHRKRGLWKVFRF